MTAFTKIYELIARLPGTTDAEKALRLSFVDRQVFENTRHELRRAGYEVEPLDFPVSIVRDPAKAIESARLLLGKPCH